MSYVDGYVLPVRKEVSNYRRLAQQEQNMEKAAPWITKNVWATTSIPNGRD
jgi:hypothetical protein